MGLAVVNHRHGVNCYIAVSKSECPLITVKAKVADSFCAVYWSELHNWATDQEPDSYEDFIRESDEEGVEAEAEACDYYFDLHGTEAIDVHELDWCELIPDFPEWVQDMDDPRSVQHDSFVLHEAAFDLFMHCLMSPEGSPTREYAEHLMRKMTGCNSEPEDKASTGKWIVQRKSQYKHSHAPYAHDKDHDREFGSFEEADTYVQQADSGFLGDTRYSYTVLPPHGV